MRFSQQGIINADPKNRLGKMAAMTAEELGGKKDVVTISVDELAMEGKKIFLFSRFLYFKWSFYQDRLGTSIGKALKKSVFGFLAGFKLLEEKKVSAVAVVNDEGQLVGEMDSNSLKMIGNAENELETAPVFCRAIFITYHSLVKTIAHFTKTGSGQAYRKS